MYLIINNNIKNKLFLALASDKNIIYKQNYVLKFGEGEKILALINGFFKKSKVSTKDIKALIINSSPGSYTSLRLVAVLANTWAYVNKISIYNFSDKDFTDIKTALLKIKKIKAQKQIEPNYGAPPKITKPKKR